MAKRLKCEYGAINMLKRNPRTISDNAYMKLRDSLESDPYMLEARGIVLWQVPDVLPEIPGMDKSPFKGQEGQLVCLGGNQRCRVLLEQGYEEIPSNWVVLAKKPDGEWWDADAAERFVLLDNNPEGIAGENDYERMIQDFNERMMAAAGIDFSNFPSGLQGEMTDASFGGGGEGDGEGEGGVEAEVETSEHGERDPELEAWIQKRENVRRDLPELMETGFYLCLIFETHGQKMEFVDKAGLAGKVEYEMFTDGIEFSKHVCGIEIERSGLHFPDMRVDARLAEMAEANDQEPIEVSVTDAVLGLRRDVEEYDSCLEWVRKAEAGENMGPPPAEIANRLMIYREWAEDEKAKAEGLLAAAEEEERAAKERKDAERMAGSAFAKAEAERRAVGMLPDGGGVEDDGKGPLDAPWDEDDDADGDGDVDGYADGDEDEDRLVPSVDQEPVDEEM